MAPTKASKAQRVHYTLPKNAISRNYRITRSSRVQDHASIPYHNRPNAICIVCRKGFGNREIQKVHFEHVHRALPHSRNEELMNQLLPAHTHRSCWPAPVVLSRQDQQIMRNKLARLEAEEPNPQTQPAEVLREWNREVDFAEAGVRTEEDYLNIKRVREYRLWQWWLDQEHMDLNAILQDRNSHVEATGDAGAVNRALRLRANTYHVDITFSVSTNPPSFTKTINASRDGTVASTNQDAEQVVAEQRAAGAGGRLTTFYELPTRGPLRPEAILQCVAEANIAFVDENGETAASRHTMATAATRFLTKIGAAPQLEQLQQHQAAFRHHDFWEAHDVSQMSPEEFATREKKQAVWYMYAFRQDRGRVYDTIQQAVYEYFDAWQDSKIERGTRSWREIVVEVLEYAKNLGADEVVDKLERYAAGNAEKLVDYLDEKFERGQR